MDLASEKIDRIEHHLRMIQEDQKQSNIKTNQILSCLVGDSVNGNVGLVHRVKDIDKRLTDIEKLGYENQVIINQLKWAVAVISTIIIGFVLDKMKLVFEEH